MRIVDVAVGGCPTSLGQNIKDMESCVADAYHKSFRGFGISRR